MGPLLWLASWCPGRSNVTTERLSLWVVVAPESGAQAGREMIVFPLLCWTKSNPVLWALLNPATNWYWKFWILTGQWVMLFSSSRQQTQTWVPVSHSPSPCSWGWPRPPREERRGSQLLSLARALRRDHEQETKPLSLWFLPLDPMCAAKSKCLAENGIGFQTVV